MVFTSFVNVIAIQHRVHYNTKHMEKLTGADATKVQVQRLREKLAHPLREVRSGHPLNHDTKPIEISLTRGQIERRGLKLREQEDVLSLLEQ